MSTPSARSVLVSIVLLGVFGPGSFGCHVLDLTPRHAQGEIDIYDDLFAVSVPDSRHAVAVGYHGTIYHTSDAGETWMKGDSGTDSLLYSVSMADAQSGWAVGQLGTILRTTDGGASWKAQPNLKVEEGSHLFGVHAVDAKRAWAVGEWGTRILTEDGGRTWKDESLTIDLQHPQFVWLSLEDQDRVRKGLDVYEDVGINDVFCLKPPSQKCWNIGEFGYIFYSEDLGRTWNRGEILGEIRMDPITLGYNQIEISETDEKNLADFAERIEDATHLNVLIDPVVSRKEYEEFYSPDDPFPLFDILSARIDVTRSVLEEAGVLSDRLRMPNKPPWDYEDFLDDDPAFLDRYFEGRIADEPMIRVGVIQNPYLFTIRFSDEKNGLISGLGGVILRSEDGGRSWKYEDTGRQQALFSVAAVDGREIAVGEKGFVRFSDDAGGSWSPPESDDFPAIFTFMRDLDFESQHELGLIVGQEGMVLKSSDGGVSWTRVLPPGGGGAGSRFL